MINSLQGIANKARRNGKYRFKNLYTMIDKELLLGAWEGLNKKASPGVDKVTFKEYKENLGNNLDDLVERLKNKTYRSQKVKRVYISKGNGKQRPLGIPALEDKIVQKAVSMILCAIYEQDFLPISYGYRVGKSARGAVVDLSKTLQFGNVRYVVEADIKSFFDNLDHDILVKMLEMRVSDSAFIRLIKKWLLAGILEPENFVINPATGTPQGGVVSPVLANIYLHYAVDKWFEEVVKPQSKGRACLYRYADDFVCVFQKQVDAEMCYGNLAMRLEKFKLELAMEKTKILKFNRDERESSERFDFLGFEFYVDVSWKGYNLIRRRTSRGKLRKALLNFKEWIKENRSNKSSRIFESVNRKLRGYFNYYGIIDNMKSMNTYFHYAKRILHKWLNRRSQRKSYTYKQFYTLVERLLYVKPRINEQKDRQLKLSWT